MRFSTPKWLHLGLTLSRIGCASCLWLAVSTACAQQAKSKSGQPKSSPSPSAAPSLNAEEVAFVQNAWTSNTAEVKLANLALQNTGSKAVKDFANRMLQDHTSANNDLNPVAKKYNVRLPLESPDAQETYQRLFKLHGAEFEQSYWKEVIEDHTKEVAAYKKAHDGAKNRDLKTYVDKIEPVIESHLQMAKQAQAAPSDGKNP